MSNTTKGQTDMPWSAFISSFMTMKGILEKCFLVDYAKKRKFRESLDPEGNVAELEWAGNLFCFYGEVHIPLSSSRMFSGFKSLIETKQNM